MRRRTFLAGGCAMLASPAARLRAAPVETQVALSYVTYAAGFTVARVEAQAVFGSAGYGMQLGFRTVGLYGAFFHTNMRTTVQGLWEGTQVAPLRLTSQGVWRGTRHETRIAYQDGMPDVQSLVPPAGTEREPVPRALQAHTIDTLSAIALLGA